MSALESFFAKLGFVPASRVADRQAIEADLTMQLQRGG